MNNTNPPAIESALRWGREQLKALDTGALDSRVLLCWCLQQPLSYLMTWPEQLLTARQWLDYQRLVGRRAQGEPVAYLTGQRQFWNLELTVATDTLIPRPETEHLVETVLADSDDAALRVLDLGTGTGAIALALAGERPHWQVMGTDAAQSIVSLARNNAERNGITNATFRVSHWFDGLNDQTFDIIVSNPPYVDEADPLLNQGDVRYEPASALVAANQGLADIEHIVARAACFLNAGGRLVLEHGHKQGEVVRQCLSQAGFHHITTVSDLAGLDRITQGRT